MQAAPRLSVIVVTNNEKALVERSFPPLVAQLRPGDELIVADNASGDGTPEAVERLAPRATLIRMPSNDGYMTACNAAAEQATGDVLLTLDTDAIVAPGFCDAMRLPASDGREWEAWMGLLTMDGGRLINTSGGVIHFTGIAWAGEVGQPVERASAVPREVGFASGACLAVTKTAWDRDPGFPPEYFLYCDDVDLSLRVRLAGGAVGIEPSARADHLYDFARRRVKWRLLERNRWATILRTYPAGVLAAVAPALLVTEVALLLVAARGGWVREKLLANADLVRWLPRLVGERRAIQGRRAISAAAFADHLTAELSSPYLGGLAESRLLRDLLKAYWALVKRLLG